jgi:methylthioribose-1-phosphate isomerase
VSSNADIVPLRFSNGVLELLEQTLLPAREEWLACSTPEQVADAIRRLAVRGAPAIGVAAAWGVVLGIQQARPGHERSAALAAATLLQATRPTAVNLAWALDEMLGALEAAGARDLLEVAHRTAAAIEERDREANRRMAKHGASLFAADSRVLTHCNAGALATAGVGTALGVIAEGFRRGGVAEVWVDETRPLLQGARLTAWELGRLGIPHRVVTDSSVGALMSRGLVDAVVVGSDRIAANVVAVLAARHGVPFYVAAPTSTVDPATASGAAIPIEERSPEEVLAIGGRRLAPETSAALNFAFDVTPAELVTAIVTEEGIARAPYREALAAMVARGHSRGAER